MDFYVGELWCLFKNDFAVDVVRQLSAHCRKPGVYIQSSWAVLVAAPVSVYGINGPIAVGTLLKLWEQGDGWLCVKCDECGEDACVYSFAGNPMTGTTSVSYQCCHCGASRQHVRTGNFIDRARTLAAAIDQYQHGQDDVEGIPFENLIALLKESRVRIV